MRRAALLVLGALLLAGCGGLPTSGGVKVVRTVAGAGDDSGDQVRVLVPGPAADADPASILAGFLDAEANGSDTDYATAREYLTPTARWDTGGTARVYQSPVSAVHLAPGGQTATVTSTDTLVATVDTRGSYVAQSTAETDTYSLVRVDGAWRISALPAGLRLTPDGLQRTFTMSTLWWFSPDLQRLVPEPRWLPAQTTGRATQLVRALLGGPSGPLVGAVRTEVPAGTVLEGSVATAGTDLSVDLSQQAASLDPAGARALLLQLAATLRQIAAVSGVRLLVAGEPLPAAGDPRRIPVADAVQYEPATSSPQSPDLVVGGGHAVVVGAGPALPPKVVAALSKLTVTRAVASPDGTSVAAVANGEVIVARPDGTVTTVSPAPDAPLSWTQDGRLAVGLTTSLLLVPPSGPVSRIPYPAALPGPVSDVRVARDGVRVVLAAGPVGHRQAYVSALAGGAFTRPVAVAPTVADASQVAWQDATDLAVISAGTGAPQLLTIDVDGSGPSAVVLPAAVGDDVTLAAGPGTPVLVAGDGAVEALTGEGGWRRVGSGSRVGVA